jgi:uncharacterized protein (TIGR02466 family)
MTTNDPAAVAQRLRKHLQGNPGDAVSWHNLASAEGDLGRARSAEQAARTALGLGLAAPETRLVLARALIDQGRLEEADAMLEEALRHRPAYAEAHRDLAQLRWMQTGDPQRALMRLEEAVARAPADAGLYLVRSIVLEFAGNPEAALQSAERGLRGAPDDLQLLMQAAHLAGGQGRSQSALAHARRAAAIAPSEHAVGISLCEALFAAGRIREAEGVADSLVRQAPLDQHAIAFLATAWRILGDERYRTVCDYNALVRSAYIEAPQGHDLGAFLAAAASELAGQHRFQTHPLQQSVRHGGQLPLHEAELERPLMKALMGALAVNVHKHLASVGSGTDPFRARNTGRAIIATSWSVRLRSGGWHADHVHPRGWLSGVFYVSVPAEITSADTGARRGWLRLGQPGVPTSPAVGPECYVKPERGLLVLFPAYMWHGVEPFHGGSDRLSVAFDALPA